MQRFAQICEVGAHMLHIRRSCYDSCAVFKGFVQGMDCKALTMHIIELVFPLRHRCTIWHIVIDGIGEVACQRGWWQSPLHPVKASGGESLVCPHNLSRKCNPLQRPKTREGAVDLAAAGGDRVKRRQAACGVLKATVLAFHCEVCRVGGLYCHYLAIWHTAPRLVKCSAVVRAHSCGRSQGGVQRR